MPTFFRFSNMAAVIYLNGGDEEVRLVPCVRDFCIMFGVESPLPRTMATIMNCAVRDERWQTPREAWERSGVFGPDGVLYAMAFRHLKARFGVETMRVVDQ